MAVDAGDGDWLLRVAATNIYDYLTDTTDLSTARGGGIALLRAITDVAQPLVERADGMPVSTGASEGVFLLPKLDADAAVDFARKLWRQLLSGGRPDAGADDGGLRDALRHATFTVSIRPVAGGYGATVERLVADGRLAQLRNPTRAVPAMQPPPKRQTDTAVCRVDRRRPAATRIARKGEVNVPVSWAVRDRRRFGVRQKQRFYLEELEHGIRVPAVPADFAGRFALKTDDPPWLAESRDAMAAWLDAGGRRFLRGQEVDEGAPDQPASPPFAYDFTNVAAGGAYPRLDGKLAVLYADGNGFGAAQRRLIAAAPDGAVEQFRLDRLLKAYRRDLLFRIVRSAKAAFEAGGEAQWDWVSDAEVGAGPKVPQLRLETLLWGGDEIIWVMPAWLGFRVMRLFAEATLGLGAGSDGAWTLDREPLHHGVGLVFCGHKAPIARVQKLARSLGDMAKEDKLERKRGRSLIAFETLESFDHLGSAPEAARTRRCPEGLTSDDLLLDAAALPAFLDTVDAIKRAGLPRRRLRRLVEDLYREIAVEQAEEAFRKRLRPEAATALAPHLAALPGLVGPLSDEAARRRLAWLQLEAVWDYVAPGVRDADD